MNDRDDKVLLAIGKLQGETTGIRKDIGQMLREVRDVDAKVDRHEEKNAAMRQHLSTAFGSAKWIMTVLFTFATVLGSVIAFAIENWR
jgi:hypothetical protein